MARRHDVAPVLIALAVLGGLAASAAFGQSVNEGIIDLRKGEVEKAVARFKALVAEDPSDLSARFWLGRAQLEASQHEAASASFKRVLEELPNSAGAHYWLGITYMKWGRAGEARAELEAALRMDPEHAEARKAIARLPRIAVAPPSDAGQTPPPPAGETRIRVDTGGLPVDIGALDLLSGNLYDYTFSSAPTDWLARSGVWAITNRWTCSPQWSWQGGYATDGIAALWNKREFAGDVTVEAYFGFKMGMGSVHSYKNPTDLNVTIHGDGANPSSGYSFMVGAERNNDTRIMKGTQILVSESDPKALLPIFEDGYPSTYEFHRKWWSVRARKHGNKLQLYLDERLVAEAVDPDPLESGHVALWTYDNGIIISRVKIYEEAEQGERRPIPGEDQLEAPRVKVAESPFTIASSSHPSVQNDFEGDVGTWSPRSEDSPVSLRLTEPGARGVGHCLAVTNTVSGGTFGANIIPGEFVVQELPAMSFDYRLPADDSVKVNFYLDVAGQLYEVIFAGPPAGSPRAEQLGAIQGVEADGEWHRAEFDLLGALSQHVSASRPIRARGLRIGNLCEAGYLLAGFGGNHLGATYCLDDFALDKPGARQVKLAFTPKRGAEVTGYSVATDMDPYTEPAETVSTSERSLEITPSGGGTWYVHARARLEDNSWTRTQHYRVRVDEIAPEIASISPTPGGAACDGPIVVRLHDRGASGIDAASIKLAVNGTDVPMDGPAVSYRPDSGIVEVDPRLVIGQPRDGDEIRLSLAPIKDRAGNEMGQPREWSYPVVFAEDTTPPPPPALKLGSEGYLCDEDFEHSIGEFTTYGGPTSARLSLDDSTAASGRRSLRVYNPVESGRFGIIRRGSFDAGKHRILSFDYKVPARLRVDIAVYVNGAMKAIKFKDTDNNLTVIGAVPNVRDDSQWHHAEINLYDLLRKDDPTAASYIVDQFVIADWNWKANVKGQVYHIDNFRVVPVTSALNGLPVAWRAPDLSGIFGLGYVIDTSRATRAPKEVALRGESGTLGNVANVNGWLHARVRDGAGNWSETTSERLLVDCEAPTAAVLAPQDGRTLATSTVELQLTDKGAAGIDPASIVLEVAGKDYTVKNRGMGGLSYDSNTGKLVWNCEQVSPQPVVLPDKTAVAVSLKSARDFAGNPVMDAPQWTWNMDYSQDRTPPRIADLTSTTHRTFLTNTFEDGLGGWSNMGGGAGAKVEIDTTTAASGKASVKLTQQQARGRMSAYITREPFQADSFPVISFDYKVPAGVKLDLIAHMASGQEYAIAFTDNPTGALGRIQPVRANGTWRHASVQLAPILRKKQPKNPLTVAYLYFADRNNLENSAGATAWFDNFVIGMVGTRGPVLRWKAADTTGITGYSHVLDRAPDTVPDEVPEGNERSFSKPGAITKGRWYFHIRALDGAGNWGPTTHYALMHLTSD